MSSRRLTRSRRTKASAAIEAKAASTPAADVEPIKTNSELNDTIEQILANLDIDEDERARRLLETLQSSTLECIEELPLDIKKKILDAWKLQAPTSPKTISKWFKEIKDFNLPHFNSKSLGELQKVTTLQLTIYHLDLMGYLPSNVKNNNNTELAENIYVQKGRDFYKHLTCPEIKKLVTEKAVGFYYKDKRHTKRGTLVQNLRDADVSVCSMSCLPPLSLYGPAHTPHWSISPQGQYQDKPDQWINEDANTIQLLVELHRLDPNGLPKKNMAELKEAIIKLRRLEEKEEEEHDSQNRMEGVGRDPTPTRESPGSPHRVVTGGEGGIVDPPVGGGGGDVHDEQIDSLSLQLANNVMVGTAGTVVNLNVTVNNNIITNNITNVTNVTNDSNNITIISNTTNDAVDNLNNDSSAVDAMNNSEREEAGNA